MAVNYGGPGVTPNLGSLVSNSLALQPGEVWPVPSGRFAVKPGKYTVFQEYDAVAQFYRTIGGGTTNANLEVVFSDGTNYRLANQTGCAVGALITNVGSGYTSAPIVTASAGGSVWRAIVGGAVNTTVTVTNGGVNYTYPPTVLFSAPPAGGIPATGYCTLSAGAVSSVTIVDQGAGYNSPPTIVFVNDPRETTPPPGSTATTGYNAAAYRMAVEGWTAAEAIGEMHAFHFNRIWVGNPGFLERLDVPGLIRMSAAAPAPVFRVWRGEDAIPVP